MLRLAAYVSSRSPGMLKRCRSALICEGEIAFPLEEIRHTTAPAHELCELASRRAMLVEEGGEHERAHRYDRRVARRGLERCIKRWSRRWVRPAPTCAQLASYSKLYANLERAVASGTSPSR
jgi:hypothetical protein